MTRLWNRWTAFLDHREPATTLALFRIACGLCVLGSIGSVVVADLVPIIWMDAKDGGYTALAPATWQFKYLGAVTPTTVWGMVILTLVSSVLLAIGLGGRITALLTLQSFIAVYRLNGDASGGDDWLLSNALWLLVLARSTATLSLDCRLRTGSWTSTAPVPAWPRYLVIYQMVLVYWSTGMQKLSVYWTPAGEFSALYYILQEPCWQRWDMNWLAWVYPVTQASTAITWIWEITSPLLLLALWYRGTRERPGRLRAFFNWIHFREVFVIVGVTLHLLILIFMALGPFSWVSLAYYICLFRPEEWSAFGRRLLRRSSRGSLLNIRPSQVTTPKSEPEVPRRKAILRNGRGVFVVFHLLAVTLMALPAPGEGMIREAWKDPTAQGEFAAWAAGLNQAGIAITPNELEERLWNAGEKYMRLRDRVLAPFADYYRLCGTTQSWRLFVGPHRYPSRLHIDVEENGQWRPVFVERDPHHDWLGHWLDHYRFRPIIYRFGWYQYLGGNDYERFAHWIATQAAPDFPEATRVRVRLCKFRTPTPEEVRAGQEPEGTFGPEALVSP